MSGAVKFMQNNVVNSTGTWQATRIAAGAGTGNLPMVERSAKELK